MEEPEGLEDLWKDSNVLEVDHADFTVRLAQVEEVILRDVGMVDVSAILPHMD